MKTILVLLGINLATLLIYPAAASDWPQLLGPTRDAVYTCPALAEEWPKNGPPVLWNVNVGEGYSNPVVADERLVVCHRIANDLGVDCLDLKDGKKLWSHQTKSEFSSSATWFGCVSSPLATDKAVILQIGGTNASVVAFDPATGAVLLWKALDERATASSPVLANFDGKPQLLIVTRSALHALDPETGKDFWQYPTRRQSSGNNYAANPVIIGDQIFLSGWYQLGALLLRLKGDKLEKLWHLDDAISTHYAAGIIYEGYVYGFHGHAWEGGGPDLRCIELATGKVMWEKAKMGSGTIIRFADKLLILSDNGELQLARASQKEFKIHSRVQVVGGTTRNYPAIADGFAYVRGPKKLVCLDLRRMKN